MNIYYFVSESPGGYNGTGIINRTASR